jgi:hypothetical protein
MKPTRVNTTTMTFGMVGSIGPETRTKSSHVYQFSHLSYLWPLRKVTCSDQVVYACEGDCLIPYPIGGLSWLSKGQASAILVLVLDGVRDFPRSVASRFSPICRFTHL